MAALANGCWSASDNTHAHLSSPMDDKERARVMKESGPYSGYFKLDFARNCALLAIVPHPQITGARKMKTVKEAQKEQEQKEREEREAKDARARGEEPVVVVRAAALPSATTAAAHLPLPSSGHASMAPSPKPGTKTLAKGGAGAASAGASRASGTSSAPSAAAIADSKLTVAQRAANDLAASIASLSAEDLVPVTEVSVRGLTTLRFWNASLSTRALALLVDGVVKGGSNIQKMFVDFNPLSREEGEDPGLVYSLLVAPSSPLQLLSLRGNLLGDETSNELMRTMCSNKNLLALDLWGNELTDGCTSEIARMLCVNSNLQSLNLSSNRLTHLGSQVLSSCFAAHIVPDKEEAKNLKKGGYRISSVKSRNYRDANSTLRVLALSQNYIAEPALRGWVDLCAEQVKYNPARGVVVHKGQEVQAMTLMPILKLTPAEHAAASAANTAREEKSKEGSRVTSANQSHTGRKRGGAKDASDAASSPTSSKSQQSVSSVAAAAALLKAKAAAAAAAQEEEDMRFPGQVNALQRIDLSKQYVAVTERTWHLLRCTPLIKWGGYGANEEVWTAEGHLNAYAVDLAAAAKEEAERQARQSEEDRARELAEAAEAEEAAKFAAANAAAAEPKKKDNRKSTPSSAGKSKAGE